MYPMNPIKRSALMIRSSFIVLWNNPTILVFPLLTIFYDIAFFLGYFYLYNVVFSKLDILFAYPILFPIYIFALYAIFAIPYRFVEAGLHLAATSALEGEKVRISAIVAKVWEKRTYILLWALFQSGAGLILGLFDKLVETVTRSLGASGSGLISQVIGLGTRVSWAVMSWFTIPQIMAHPDYPIPSLRAASSLLKKTWGEGLSMVGEFGLFFLAGLAVNGIFIYLLNFFPFVHTFGFNFPLIDTYVFIPWVPLIVTGIWFFLLTVASACLTSIQRAALYRYADTGDYVGPFPKELLAHAFDGK